MLIWLNGPFGVGKTATARALLQQLPGALLYDHEHRQQRTRAGLRLQQGVHQPRAGAVPAERWQDGQLRQVPGLLQRRVVGAQLSEDAVVPPVPSLGARAEAHPDDNTIDNGDIAMEVGTGRHGRRCTDGMDRRRRRRPRATAEGRRA
jgi:hypothetical protein